MHKHFPKVIFLLFIMLSTSAPSVFAQVADGQNLIINPSGEERLSIGWSIGAGDWQQGQEVRPQHGSHHFFAGVSQEAVLLQDIDVSAYAEAIDAGEQSFQFEGYIQSHSGFGASDSARILIIYWDGESTEDYLDVFDTGEQIILNRWERIEDTRLAPPETRVITIILVSLRYGGSDNDGYFDNLSLVALGDAPQSPIEVVTAPTRPAPDDGTDSDGDGTSDNADRCLGFLSGASVEDASGCPTNFDPYVDLSFDDGLHEAWYERFWTGSCANVPVFFCFDGPGWYDTIEILLSKISQSEAGYARNRMWALGRAVGFDWARDNNIDFISTDDLQAWGRLLEQARTEAEIFDAIAVIEDEVCNRLGSTYILGGFAQSASCNSPTPEIYTARPDSQRDIASSESAGGDSDRDGVADAMDLCPGRIPGAGKEDESGCPENFEPNTDLIFDHATHEAWYGNFWTGECTNVPGFCFSGSGWFDTIDQLLQLFPDTEQGYVRNRLWALGRAVGFEWAKDNHIRVIDTGDLQNWGGILQGSTSAGAVLDTLTSIEDEVCNRLGSDAIWGDWPKVKVANRLKLHGGSSLFNLKRP